MMDYCSKTDDYLAGFLEGEELDAFKGHLDKCASCSHQVSQTKNVDSHIKDWMDNQITPTATRTKAVAIIERTQASTANSIGFERLILVGTAAALIISMGVYLFFANKTDTTNQLKVNQFAKAPLVKPDTIDILIKKNATVSNINGKTELATNKSGRLLVSAKRDTFGVNENSNVVILRSGKKDALINLNSGTIAVKAEERSKDESLIVTAAGYHVKVVGTRFSVTLTSDEGILVRVSSGIVSVSKPGVKELLVTNGQAVKFFDNTYKIELLDENSRESLEALLSKQILPMDQNKNKLDSVEQIAKSSTAHKSKLLNSGDERKAGKNIKEPIPVNQFDKMIVRKLIVKGNLKEAKDILTTHLENNPSNGEAWLLLADCRRKSAQWDGAVVAYKKTFTTSKGSLAYRARFMAGVVLQDKLKNCAEAAPLFKAYISGSQKPLEAEAMFRLAKCYRSTGQLNLANELLQNIVTNHQGTTAAEQARSLLQK